MKSTTMMMTPTAASLTMIWTQISDQTWVSMTSNPVASVASNLSCFFLFFTLFISSKWISCVGVASCAVVSQTHTCIFNSTYFVFFNVKCKTLTHVAMLRVTFLKMSLNESKIGQCFFFFISVYHPEVDLCCVGVTYCVWCHCCKSQTKWLISQNHMVSCCAFL